MGYNEEQTFELQKKPLNEYLLNSEESCFRFLYPSGLTKKIKKLLQDVTYLQTLQITSKEDVLRWYDIYRKHDFLSKPLKEQFSTLFCKYAEYTMEGVMDAIQQVAERKSDYLTEQYLMEVSRDKLIELLRHQPSELIFNSEKLIIISKDLPWGWNTFREATLIPAIIFALRTDNSQFVGPLAEKRIENLINCESYYWELKEENSSVYKIVEKELDSIRKKRYDAIMGKKKCSKKIWAIGWLVFLLIGAGVVLCYFTANYRGFQDSSIEMVTDTLANEEALADTLINNETITDTLTNKETNIDNGRTEDKR